MSLDPQILALLGGTLVASLAGSLHCAGMCGPLAMVACSGPSCPREPAPTPLTHEGTPLGRRASGGSHATHATYHAARGGSYILLGAAAGALGSLAHVAGMVAGMQRAAMIVGGATLLFVGAGMLCSWGGVPLRLPMLPPRVRGPLARAHARILALPPRRRALMLGLGAPLLPCGWLWAFVAVAASTGAVSAGAAVMALFWLGTVPALAAVALGARTALARVGAGRAAQLVRPAVATALVALGVQMAVVRSGSAAAVVAAVHSPGGCGGAEATRALHRAEDEVPACCRSAHDGTRTAGDSARAADTP